MSDLKEFIDNVLGNEVARIITESEPNPEVNTEVISMIQQIEGGEEPIMLRIITDRASGQEIDQWLCEQGISNDEKDEVLELLRSYFFKGTRIAKKMNKPSVRSNLCTVNFPTTHSDFSDNTTEIKNTEILEELHCILNDIATMENRVRKLISVIANKN